MDLIAGELSVSAILFAVTRAFFPDTAPPMVSPTEDRPLRSASSDHPPAVRIFWTGGWDSSYRVLELAITLRKTVQPYYMHDESRRAAPYELRAIDSILDRLAVNHPDARARILPLVRIPMIWHLVPDDSFSQSLAEIRLRGDFGAQYAYIARECTRLDLQEVEMCIHVGDLSGTNFSELFRDRLELVCEQGVTRHRIKGPADRDGISRLFSRLRFPLHNLTKLQSRDRARALGFERLLHQTWFCHHPRSGRPCGVCNPCRHAIEDGFGWRIGLIGRCRRLFRWITKPLNTLRHLRSN